MMPPDDLRGDDLRGGDLRGGDLRSGGLRSGDGDDLIRRRRRSRAIVTGVLLAVLVVLVFAITLSRIRLSMS